MKVSMELDSEKVGDKDRALEVIYGLFPDDETDDDLVDSDGTDDYKDSEGDEDGEDNKKVSDESDDEDDGGEIELD